MKTFVYLRRSSFADSDAAGVIHFSRLACYVEEAEHAFLASEGLPICLGDAEAVGWPRVSFEASYLRPMLPLCEFRVELTLLATGASSLQWEWRIVDAEGHRCAEGKMKTVCARRTASGFESILLPEKLRLSL